MNNGKPKLEPGEIDKLKDEQLLGSRAEHAYEEFIKPFVENKRQVLFQAFRDLPLTAEIELMEVKRMMYAVNALDDEIKSVITTGRMASKTLSESENEVKH